MAEVLTVGIGEPVDAGTSTYIEFEAQPISGEGLPTRGHVLHSAGRRFTTHELGREHFPLVVGQVPNPAEFSQPTAGTTGLRVIKERRSPFYRVPFTFRQFIPTLQYMANIAAYLNTGVIDFQAEIKIKQAHITAGECQLDQSMHVEGDLEGFGPTQRVGPQFMAVDHEPTNHLLLPLPPDPDQNYDSWCIANEHIPPPLLWRAQPYDVVLSDNLTPHASPVIQQSGRRTFLGLFYVV